MEIITDLHLHSKYSRAVSRRMVVEEMAGWAQKKGIDLVGTADWTHPLWLKELESKLIEIAPGLYGLKSTGPAVPSTSEVKFLLATEIASIYSQGGKMRRIHNLILAPSFETVKRINAELNRRGVNLLSDGRPITGISARDLVAMVLEIDENCLVVPAHCLLPDENLHTQQGIKPIKDIEKGDRVYTHKNRWRMVEKLFVRPFRGKVYQIIPDYFRLGITVTGEHPFWAIKTKKNCPSINKSFGICKPVCSQKEYCRRRYFERYQPIWVLAKDLERGDILVFPRFTKIKDKKYIKLRDYLDKFKMEKSDLVSPGGYRRHKIRNLIKIDKNFCRLSGLFLAEGYTTRDLISFCFSEKEKKSCEQVKGMIKEIFGIEKFREYKRRDYKAIELTFYSKILHQFFSKFFYQNSNKRRADSKCLPAWMLELPIELQKEILIGWWQGDKGYTTSRLLMNQMKIICLRLGIIPAIGKDSKKDHKNRGKHDRFENRTITAAHDTYHFSNLSFFEDPFGLLRQPFLKKYKTKLKRRRGWIDKDYVYLPIRKIVKKNYEGKVYNLEVEKDNSYTAEFACVHNCWTPWFSLYGSKSGFDSIKECYQDMSDYIYAIETGLSSDPGMNWRVKDLDKRQILSCSDAHSPEKLGREATVFEMPEGLEISYEAIRKAIIGKGKGKEAGIGKVVGQGDLTLTQRPNRPPNLNQKTLPYIAYTIEFYPEEGKYHYTGHRNCGVRQSPEETKKLGATCPVCGKPLTVGVMHRVEQLADREVKAQKKEGKTGATWVYDRKRPPYVMLVPLMEVIAEAQGSTPHSQKVMGEYERLVAQFGAEFAVLLKTETEKIATVSGPRVAEGILRVRSGQVIIKPGFDGVFGEVHIWPSSAKTTEGKQKQMSLF